MLTFVCGERGNGFSMFHNLIKVSSTGTKFTLYPLMNT